MKQAKQSDIAVPTEVILGLIGVLQSPTVKKQLKGTQRKVVLGYAVMLEKALKTGEKQAQVKLSLQMVANILRIILMIIKPDPLVKAAITILGKFI